MLINPKELKSLFPSDYATTLKKRALAKEVLKRKKFGVVVGPCSIHDIDSTLEYASKLQELALQLENCELFMRVYFEKPRSKGGWRGFLYDPFLDNSNNIEEGLILTRKLLCHLVNLGIGIATEFLDPLFTPYFSDLIAWGFIGSRTSSSQIHRQLASSFDFPIGFKNSPDGSIEIANDSVEIAKNPHIFPLIDDDGKIALIKSRGNPYTHLVLRGGKKPNYHLAPSIKSSLMIDCSHGNSQKKAEAQNEVLLFAMCQKNVFGVMLESHLLAGSQSFSSKPKYGISITDSCLDFESTAELILHLQHSLQEKFLFLILLLRLLLQCGFCGKCKLS